MKNLENNAMEEILLVIPISMNRCLGREGPEQTKFILKSVSLLIIVIFFPNHPLEGPNDMNYSSMDDINGIDNDKSCIWSIIL